MVLKPNLVVQSDNFLQILEEDHIIRTTDFSLDFQPTAEILTPVVTPITETSPTESVIPPNSNGEDQSENESNNTESSDTSYFSDSETNSNMSTAKPKLQIIPLPPFMSNKVGLWLKLVKSRLEISGVEAKDLYKYACLDIPIELIEKIPDILDVKAKDNRSDWDIFSEKVSEAYGKSRDEEINELLRGLKLSETKGPKVLMGEMIELAGDDFTVSYTHLTLPTIYSV